MDYSQVQFWIQTGVTVVAIGVYISVFLYQRKMMKAYDARTDRIEKSVDIIDKAFNLYQKMLNVDEIEKVVSIKVTKELEQERAKIVVELEEKYAKALKDNDEAAKMQKKELIQQLASLIQEFQILEKERLAAITIKNHSIINAAIGKRKYYGGGDAIEIQK